MLRLTTAEFDLLMYNATVLLVQALSQEHSRDVLAIMGWKRVDIWNRAVRKLLNRLRGVCY